MKDIDIARAARLRPIEEVGATLGIAPAHLVPYGRWKAKLEPAALDRAASAPRGKLILVTAISPSPPARARRRRRSGSATDSPGSGKRR